MDLTKTISLLRRKMNTELNRRLEKIGLTNSKSMILKRLYKNGVMTQVELCRELELDKSTVAKTLDRMQDIGLIDKKTNPDDSRSYLVYLTPKAHQLIPKTHEVLTSWTNDVTEGMTETEKELFYEMLQKIADRATDICNME